MRFEFIVYSAIQGYHEYKDIWKNPIIGGELKCQREIGNRHDPLAMAMLKQIDGHNTIVGHVSRKIVPLAMLSFDMECYKIQNLLNFHVIKISCRT